MNRSDSIAQIAAALAKAQAEVHGATKDKTNPHLKSKYADLESVWDACRAALTKNDLSIVQMPTSERTADGAYRLAVETVLMHKSGEWIGERLEMPLVKTDPQGVGSAITYARRYALASMTSVCPTDDDGEAATRPAAASRAAAPAPAPTPAPAPAKDEGTDAETKRRDRMKIRFDETCEEIAKTTDDRKQGVIGNALASVKLWYGASRVSALTDEQFEEFLKRLWDEATAPASA